MARHPEQVRILVAHEPPAAQVLPDREQALAAAAEIHQTYQRSGIGPAVAKFITLVSHKGPVPADFADQPVPNPAAFGLPTDDDGSRKDPPVGQNFVSGTHYQPNRAAVAVAERLGTTPVTFPSDHGGFLGGEYGQTGDPDAFAATLREVLTSRA
jgi:hypothetical protein